MAFCFPTVELLLDENLEKVALISYRQPDLYFVPYTAGLFPYKEQQ